MEVAGVVNCYKNNYDIFIGRPSKWGNPFKFEAGVSRSREYAIERYERWIQNQPELLAALPELDGKMLGCFCSPRPCHGDVLVKLVSEL